MTDTDDATELNFRGYVTQKAVVFNERDEILIVRPGTDGSWSIPGGRVQDGEDADEALAREIREETDLSVRVCDPVHTMTEVWHTSSGEPMFTVVYRCVTDERSIELNHEHEAYQWTSFENARASMPFEPLGVAVERAHARHQHTPSAPSSTN